MALFSLLLMCNPLDTTCGHDARIQTRSKLNKLQNRGTAVQKYKYVCCIEMGATTANVVLDLFFLTHLCRL